MGRLFFFRDPDATESGRRMGPATQCSLTAPKDKSIVRSDDLVPGLRRGDARHQLPIIGNRDARGRHRGARGDLDMTAIEPAVWTADTFKDESTPRSLRKRGRGTVLQAIDSALRDFDSYRISMGTDDKLRRAYFVIQCCRLWLGGKAGKVSKTNTLRREAITTLAGQCWAYIQYHTYEQKKRAGAHGQLRAMGTGYQGERAHYVQMGKRQNPISGSYMHEASEDPAAANILNGRTFSQLTLQDYVALDQHFQGQFNDPFAPGMQVEVRRHVYFMNKQERMRYMIIVDNGDLRVSFDTLYNTFQSQAYVMDRYGNLYSTSVPVNRASGTNFNHSTFNAGKDVICAGILNVRAGKLQRIDNSSGHYKPTRQNLHNALTILNRLGADLSQATVVVSEQDLTRPGKLIEHEYAQAAVFVANMNAIPTRSIPQP